MRRLAHVIEFLAQPVGDLAVDLLGGDGAVVALIDRQARASTGCRSASTAEAMSGYCSLHASIAAVERRRRDAPGRARPRAPPRARSCLNFASQSGPSSPAMRRLTKVQPIGGALACSATSSPAYSCGSALGMVARSCATFISGPLMPPSADLQIGGMARPVDRRCRDSAPPRAAPRARPSRSRRAHSAATAREGCRRRSKRCVLRLRFAPLRMRKFSLCHQQFFLTLSVVEWAHDADAASSHRLEFVDEAGDHVQALLPERRVATRRGRTAPAAPCAACVPPARSMSRYFSAKPWMPRPG